MSNTKDINFMGRRKIALAFSLVLLVIAIGSLVSKGINFGLDFTGGTLIEVAYEQPVKLSVLRQDLTAAGFDTAVVQNFGAETEVIIRLQRGSTNELGDEILALLQSKGEKVTLKRIEFVGPQVGDDLKEQGGMALLLALAVVMIYVAIRFQMKFSVGAVVALIHDVIITLGFFSFFQWEFDLTVLAALLAVIGYSLNDTIVVYDRVRENFRFMRTGTPLEVINTSLNQTLSRTIVTSLTTLMVLIILLIFGGELIRGFAMALSLGVFIGTYSSVYISASILMLLHTSKEDLIVAVKDDEEFDTP
jgi:preprotein translocase subunit SecF